MQSLKILSGNVSSYSLLDGVYGSTTTSLLLVVKAIDSDVVPDIWVSLTITNPDVIRGLRDHNFKLIESTLSKAVARQGLAPERIQQLQALGFSPAGTKGVPIGIECSGQLRKLQRKLTGLEGRQPIDLYTVVGDYTLLVQEAADTESIDVAQLVSQGDLRNGRAGNAGFSLTAFVGKIFGFEPPAPELRTAAHGSGASSVASWSKVAGASSADPVSAAEAVQPAPVATPATPAKTAVPV